MKTQTPDKHDAFIRAVALMAGGICHLCPNLGVSDNGLLVESTGGYRRITNPDELTDSKPVYLSFIANDAHPAGEGLQNTAEKVIQAHLKKLDRVIHTSAQLTGEPVPDSHFSVTTRGNRIYVDISPLLESPECARQTLEIQKNRGFWIGLGAVAGTGLILDGRRRMKKEKIGSSEQILAGIEIASGIGLDGLAAGEAVATGIRESIRARPNLAGDQSRKNWERFADRISEQAANFGKPIER